MNLLIEKTLLGDEDIPVNDVYERTLVGIIDFYIENPEFDLSTGTLARIIKRLIEFGWFVNFTKRPNCGTSFLYRACESNRFDLVKLLLENGENADFGDFKNTKHPLEIACIKKHSEIANLLLDHGAEIDFDPESMYHTFFCFYTYAFRCGNLQLIDRIICKKAGEAAETYSELSVNERIVKLGEEVKNSSFPIASDGRFTMLHVACASGKFDMVKEFIEMGLDVHATVCGFSMIHFAVISENLDCLNYFSNLDVKYFGSPSSPLHLAVSYSDDLTITKRLIELGHDINAVNNNGQTPIHYAASLFKYNFLKYFIDLEDSNCEVLDSQGSSPIDVFFEKLKCFNKLETISILVHPKVINRSWFWICTYYRWSLLEILVDNGIDVNLLDEKGRNGVFYAVESSDDDLLWALYNLGLDINLKDCDGMTPLDFAKDLGDDLMIWNLERCNELETNFD